MAKQPGVATLDPRQLCLCLWFHALHACKGLSRPGVCLRGMGPEMLIVGVQGLGWLEDGAWA